MLSGGKDSAYLSYMLKRKYHLSLLGFIIDINYEYPETFENAKSIANKLKLPYVIYRQDPELMKKYYHFLFTEKTIVQPDFGQVCMFCGRFFLRTASEFAKAFKIPTVFAGHNPNQIMGLGENYVIDTTDLMRQRFIKGLISEQTRKASIAWKRRYGIPPLPLFPEALCPREVELIFPFQYFPYRPTEMIKTVRKELGWTPMKHFSSAYLVSGCKLSKLWYYLALINHTNSYIDFELSEQVRSGELSRDELKDFYNHMIIDYKEIEKLATELGIIDKLPLKMDKNRLIRK
ncbi:hypothetical protein J7J45_03085 [Candidatus Aerophobetes bacterium]|nr:hypothetical protein [Candidatus Aerophobetes bacterium]